MDDLAGIASALRDRLLAPLESDPDFWTFAADSRRTMGHAFFNYPAMMVPQVQGALLDAWIFNAGDGGVDCVWVNGVKQVDGGRHRMRDSVTKAFFKTMKELAA